MWRCGAGKGGQLRRGSMLHCKSIAPKYGVTPKTIRDVWSGRSWAKTTRHLWTDEEIRRRGAGEPEGDDQDEDMGHGGATRVPPGMMGAAYPGGDMSGLNASLMNHPFGGGGGMPGNFAHAGQFGNPAWFPHGNSSAFHSMQQQYNLPTGMGNQTNAYPNFGYPNNMSGGGNAINAGVLDVSGNGANMGNMGNMRNMRAGIGNNNLGMTNMSGNGNGTPLSHKSTSQCVSLHLPVSSRLRGVVPAPEHSTLRSLERAAAESLRSPSPLCAIWVTSASGFFGCDLIRKYETDFKSQKYQNHCRKNCTDQCRGGVLQRLAVSYSVLSFVQG